MRLKKFYEITIELPATGRDPVQMSMVRFEDSMQVHSIRLENLTSARLFGKWKFQFLLLLLYKSGPYCVR